LVLTLSCDCPGARCAASTYIAELFVTPVWIPLHARTTTRTTA
jgi:hypothetical protein